MPETKRNSARRSNAWSPTYQPAGRHGSEHKGEAFEKQMELVEHKEAQREGTPRRHEGRRGNYGARSLPRHEAAVKE
ncbi:MAG: hypothetical protein ACLU3I_21565 [Acutalibacteraceae bacterium]